MGFIVFNTRAQATNYVKRQKSYRFDEGCGCCWHSQDYYINNNLVILDNSRENKGAYYHSKTVIGRIKR